MELTKCHSKYERRKSLVKHDNNYSKMYPNPDGNSLREKTVYSGEDSMDITRSHTVKIDNQIFKQVQTNVQKATAPVSEKEMMVQNHIIVSELGHKCKLSLYFSCISGKIGRAQKILYLFH